MTSGRNKRAVVNVTTGKIYESVKAAAEDYGVLYHLIIRAARGGRLCRKCLWKYADSDLVIRERPKYLGHTKAVMDLETKARWVSEEDAGKSLGLTRGQIQKALSKHRPVNGLKLVLEDDYKKYGETLLDKFSGKEELRFCRNIREIVCLETGVHYETATNAAKKLGVTKQLIDVAAKKGRSAGGYHFYYADVDPNTMRFVDPNSRKPSLEIMDLKTNRLWGSIKECAKELGMARSTAYRSLRLGLPLEDGTKLVYYRDWLKQTTTENDV